MFPVTCSLEPPTANEMGAVTTGSVAESLADAPPELVKVQDAAFATASAQPFPFQSIRPAQVLIAIAH